MPTPNTSLPTLTREFAGISITVPSTFAEGHALSKDEAGWVNSQLATVVGNQFGGYIRRAKEALDAKRLEAFKAKKYDGPMDETGKRPAPATFADLGWDAQKVFTDLYTDYDLAGNRRGDGTPARDPVTSLVNFLASEAIKAKLKAKSLNIRTYMTTKMVVDGEEITAFANLVNQYIDAHPELVDQAKAQLASAAPQDDELDLTLPSAPVAEAAE